MTRTIKILVLLFIVINFIHCKKVKTEQKNKNKTKNELIDSVFKLAEYQYSFLIKKTDTLKPLLQPRSLKPNGTLKLVSKSDWTSGFFPGALWYLYEYTNASKWKNKAEKYTRALDSAQFIKSNHDVGFMIQNSFGNGYRLTKHNEFKAVVVQAAKSLLTRYRPQSKIIQSWDTNAPWIKGRGLDMPVIIDNMMNLNLLYMASKHTGDSIYHSVANAHATSTLNNHYRTNYSCFHVVDYDHVTGKVRKKVNFQGYADASSWARGQAWGLYGFVECYKNSNKEEYLNQAKQIANYIISSKKIPENNIPFWDYDAKSEKTIPRDASAAAIVASALLDLQSFDKKNKNKYMNYASTILKTLSSSEYLAEKNNNGGFILKHSVGNFHENNETDAPINYADYYFLEALLKWKSIN